jgi:hypothetical protein
VHLHDELAAGLEQEAGAGRAQPLGGSGRPGGYPCRAFEERAAEVVADYRAKVLGLPVADRLPTDLELVF